MDRPPKTLPSLRKDLYSLEADIAFFEARLSFAGDAPDTMYQRAQIKTYQTLGSQMGATLERMRSLRRGARRVGGKDPVAA